MLKKSKNWKSKWLQETEARLAEGRRVAANLGTPKRTQAEVAKIMGISRATVVRLEALALSKISKEIMLAVKMAEQEQETLSHLNVPTIHTLPPGCNPVKPVPAISPVTQSMNEPLPELSPTQPANGERTIPGYRTMTP